MRAHRGTRTQRDTEEATGIPRSTLGRLELGTHAPSADTALALARWLGWTMEQVMEASKTPADPTPNAP